MLRWQGQFYLEHWLVPSQLTLKNNRIIVRTSLNFSMKAFRVHPILQHFFFLWRSVALSTKCLPVLMALFNCYLPFSENDLIPPNWMIGYVRAGVLMFISLPDSTYHMSCKYNGVRSYTQFNLWNQLFQLRVEREKALYLTLGPSLLPLGIGLCCPQGKGNCSGKAERHLKR